VKFEINITAYKYLDTIHSLIRQFKSTYLTRNLFIRVWDNSPQALKIEGADEVRWNRFNPSLSRVWNWAIAQSIGPWVMVVNDDIKFHPNWYKDLCEDYAKEPKRLWHGPSRCFLFHKDLLTKVGWFDERMNGFTFEDLDYIRRLNHAGVGHNYGSRSTLHINAKSLKDSLVDRAEANPANNNEFLNTKYAKDGMEDFLDPPLFSTPDFYPCRP